MEERYLSLSDHNYITFTIRGRGRKGLEIKRNSRNGKGVTTRRWKMETLDQEIFDEALKWKCESHKIGEWTTEACVRKDIDWMQETMTEAADLAMKRAKKKPNQKQVYWWNETAGARAKCIKDRRRWTRAKSKKRKMNKNYRGREVDEENL